MINPILIPFDSNRFQIEDWQLLELNPTTDKLLSNDSNVNNPFSFIKRNRNYFYGGGILLIITCFIVYWRNKENKDKKSKADTYR